MNISQIFVGVSILVLAVVAAVVFFTGKRRNTNRLTPLAGLAFAFTIAGICFGESRFLGYSLFGVGIILAVVDMVNRTKAR